MRNALAGLTIGSLFLVSSSAALAEDVVVAEAGADQEGAGSLCITADKIASHDDLVELIKRQVKIEGQVRSIDVEGQNAKLAFHAEPGRHVEARVPADVVSANGLHECAAPLLGGYWPATGGVFALGGIFGGLCAAGELGCGSSSEHAPPPVVPPGPPPVHPPVPRPISNPIPTPPAVSPFR